jgi:hypothetical protein
MDRLKHRGWLLLQIDKATDPAVREAFMIDLREVSRMLGLPVPASLEPKQLPLLGV